MRESDLYLPVKEMLESQGYTVKGEIGSADIAAVRGDEPPLIVELKTGFTLGLVHQAIERRKISDTVYVAVPEWNGRAGWKAFRRNLTLCRLLGIGAITVRDGKAQVHLDPGPYQPRKSKPRTHRLLGEFHKRVGDPNLGGTNRTSIVTAYRQDALRCLDFLHENGPCKAAQVSDATGVKRARTIMADDHYGWFERVERGIYQVTPKGAAARQQQAGEIGALK
ncbi:MAG: DUF2161 family putative PD-(D/E)XK-type phosphodiesterase [Rhizobiaceae bacterium]